MYDTPQGHAINDATLRRGLILLAQPVVEIVRYLNDVTQTLRGHEPTAVSLSTSR